MGCRHCLLPGGGLSKDGLRWVRPQRPDYFLPQARLAARLRTRFKKALQRRQPELFAQVPATVWRMKWVADVQAVGSGEPALKYLARYVYRTAFSAETIVADDQRGVTFRYRDNAGRARTLTLSPEKFLHRFLQHVLPKGFQRVRHFGWLSPAARKRFARIAALLDGKAPESPRSTPPSEPPLCPCCQRPMRLIEVLPRPPPAPQLTLHLGTGTS